MSFSKNDLDTIKSKIQLSSEIQKKVKVIKKGNDYWCCCLFHEEKTPSCKINDALGSYYCFGCGAKGDIFTIYTELYNYTFPDAVKELASRVGIKVTNELNYKNKDNEKIFKILEISTKWFQENIKDNKLCLNYLKDRSLSKQTIEDFRIGYSYNSKTSLYDYLKGLSFEDEDILKSNVAKIDNNKKIRDFFYKRLIFPIANEQNKIVGFGGRVLDNSNPKYINSPESDIFKKRSILYNLNQAKEYIRSKKNILICEGYMDVISLNQNNIKTAVAPLGTALTETQLLLSWKYVNKPTIMFDGDSAGVRASYKTALMALEYLTPNKYLQFIRLPSNYDPDNYINKYSLKKFVEVLKNPISIVNFIFDQSVSTIDLKKADNKISFDKYIDDIVGTIKDKKIRYFYKNEFKNLFFQYLKNPNKNKTYDGNFTKIDSLVEKQIYSFLAAYLNHKSIRNELILLYKSSDLFSSDYLNFIEFFNNENYANLTLDELNVSELAQNTSKILTKIRENCNFNLFPYAKKDHETDKTLLEIEESIENLNTRLSNLKKINKSLNNFESNSSSLTWDELKKLSNEVHVKENDFI